MPENGQGELAHIKRCHHSDEQIIDKLTEADKLVAHGQAVAEVDRHLEITESIDDCWRNEFDSMKSNEAKHLEKLPAEAELDKAMFNGFAGGSPLLARGDRCACG